jgi:hypothetical protein
MNDKMLHMMLERDVLFLRLTLNGFESHHDIAEVAVSSAGAGRK